MANSALTEIDALGSIGASVFGECAGPRHVVRIDIDDCGFGIDCRTTPFRTTVKARENHRVYSHVEGDKLPFTAKLRKVFERPLMGFRRAIGEQVFGEELPRIREGQSGKRLPGRSDFARHVAWRVLAIFHWK